jgi:hypothetical protein
VALPDKQDNVYYPNKSSQKELLRTFKGPRIELFYSARIDF